MLPLLWQVYHQEHETTNSRSPPTDKMKETKMDELRAHVGDIIESRYSKYKLMVAEVLFDTSDQERDDRPAQPLFRDHVTAYRIMPNGQTLSNNPIFLGRHWSHAGGKK